MKRTSLVFTFIFIGMVLAACQASTPQVGTMPETPNQATAQVEPGTSSSSGAPDSITVKAEVWADNWFAFYLADQLIKEDSVSITTERSFNSETFTFTASYPMTLNFIAKDFKENDTGLEYIGSNRQQMGDGGLIAQFTNAQTGEVNRRDECRLVLHRHP